MSEEIQSQTENKNEQPKEKQSASSLMKELAAQLEDLRDSPNQLEAWLRWNNQFTDYSVNNRMYIFVQMPTATRVASFKKWQDLNRQVQKGQTSIKIFAPSKFVKRLAGDDDSEENKMVVAFRAIPVFDISQTEGDPIDILPAIHGEDALNVLKEECVVALNQLGVQIEHSSSASLGDVSDYSTVFINDALPESSQSASIIRQLAGVHLTRHLTPKLKDGMAKREFDWITSAASWAIMNRRGIEATEFTASFLNSYTGEFSMKDLLNATDQVVTFLDALDAGIPAEWASAIVDNANNS